MTDRMTKGIWIKVNPRNGYIEGFHIVADSDQEQSVIEGALARITKPSCWGWIRRLVQKRGGLY